MCMCAASPGVYVYKMVGLILLEQHNCISLIAAFSVKIIEIRSNPEICTQLSNRMEIGVVGMFLNSIVKKSLCNKKFSTKYTFYLK